MKTRAILRTAFLAAWAGFAAWFVRHEAFPHVFSDTVAGYDDVLPRDMLVRDSWMRIMLNGTPLGYSHSSSDVNETSFTHYYEIVNEVRLHIGFAGAGQTIDIDTTLNLDLTRQLRSFRFALEIGGNTVTVSGTRVQRETYAVTMKSNAGTSTQRIQIPSDAILFSPAAELMLTHLKPGRTLNLRVIDPMSLNPRTLSLRAVRAETVEAAGERVRATLVTFTYLGSDIRLWVAPGGRVVRQETPFGWTVEACSPEAAFAALDTAQTRNPSPDRTGGAQVQAIEQLFNWFLR